MNKPMRFLFFGFHRAWKPLKGFPAPAGLVCEMRSYPGGLVAQGTTPDEAVANLRKTVRMAVSRAKDPEAWYENAVLGMSAEERKDAHELWDRVFFERRELEKFDGLDDYFGVNQEAEYATFLKEDARLEEPCPS